MTFIKLRSNDKKNPIMCGLERRVFQAGTELRQQCSSVCLELERRLWKVRSPGRLQPDGGEPAECQAKSLDALL